MQHFDDIIHINLHDKLNSKITAKSQNVPFYMPLLLFILFSFLTRSERDRTKERTVQIYDILGIF